MVLYYDYYSIGPEIQDATDLIFRMATPDFQTAIPKFWESGVRFQYTAPKSWTTTPEIQTATPRKYTSTTKFLFTCVQNTAKQG